MARVELPQANESECEVNAGAIGAPSDALFLLIGTLHVPQQPTVFTAV